MQYEKLPIKTKLKKGDLWFVGENVIQIYLSNDKMRIWMDSNKIEVNKNASSTIDMDFSQHENHGVFRKKD